MLPIALIAPTPFPAHAVYGIGTALPVGAIAVALALGARGTAGILRAAHNSQGLLNQTVGAIMFLGESCLTLSLSPGLIPG